MLFPQLPGRERTTRKRPARLSRRRVAYKLASLGTCIGTGTWIESKASCEAAAARLGLPDVTAQDIGAVDGTDGYPFGCYYKKSSEKLYLNSAGGKNGNDPDRVSVCSGTCHLAALISFAVPPRQFPRFHHVPLKLCFWFPVCLFVPEISLFSRLPYFIPPTFCSLLPAAISNGVLFLTCLPCRHGVHGSPLIHRAPVCARFGTTHTSPASSQGRAPARQRRPSSRMRVSAHQVSSRQCSAAAARVVRAPPPLIFNSDVSPVPFLRCADGHDEALLSPGMHGDLPRGANRVPPPGRRRPSEL